MQTQVTLLLLGMLLWVGCKGAELDQTIALEPGTSHPFTVQGEQEKEVGWELVDKTQGESCPERQCIKLERKDQMGYVGGQHGSAMNFTPKDGKMDFELKNLSNTTLKIRFYTDKPL